MPKRVVGQLKDRLDIEWEIPDFLSLSVLVNKSYVSPVSFLGNTSWYLRVYPNGMDSSGLVSICVIRGHSGPPVTVTIDLSLQRKNHMRTLLTKRECTFDKEDSIYVHICSDLSRSELIDQQSEFLPSGALTVICSLRFGEDFRSKEPAVAAQDIKVVRDYKELLLSEENSDVTLQVSGQKFKAHRIILGIRSPVFAAMLCHNMTEKNTGLINIEDCDPANFREFLRFLYCGSLDSITSQNMCALYRAADKYEVVDLKSECLKVMKNNFTVNNFCDILTLALLHSEAELIQRATEFFSKNLPKIILIDKWQTFLTENPTQCNQLFTRLASFCQSD